MWFHCTDGRRGPSCIVKLLILYTEHVSVHIAFVELKYIVEAI